MGLYDIHIGQLLDGRRSLEGTGYYHIMTEKEHMVTDSLEGITGRHCSMLQLEETLYQACLEQIQEFTESSHNQDVYTFSLYTDSSNGSYYLYLNNLQGLETTAQYYFEYYKQRHQEKNESSYDRTLDEIRTDMKYAAGDFPFMLDDMGDQLDEILQPYQEWNERSFHYEEGEQPAEITAQQRDQLSELDADSIMIVDAELTDSGAFYLIALRVIQRLQPALQQLDQTDDFMAYVCSADGEGGDFLTWSTLVRKTNTLEQIYLANPEERKYDVMFEEAREQQLMKSVKEQFEYWMNEIKNNKWNTNKSVITRCNKTDYFAYAAVRALGYEVVPVVQQALNTENDDLLIKVYKMLLQELDHSRAN